MSSYPEAFKLNCVGKLPTDNNYSVCQEKPIILENNNVVPKGAKHLNRGCAPYKAPKNVIQDNTFQGNKVSAKSWSNTRGYGNIVVGTYDINNDIHGRIHPWNRITPLTQPYDTPVVVKDAWSMNKVKHIRE